MLHLRKNLTTVTAALIVTAAAAGAAAPAADADSIAYIKGGDIWLTTPDGARQVQVTTTGGYSDVSQADDGTMIGLSGIRLHKLDRTGKVLADFDTPVSDKRPAPQKTFYGPFDPAISPDGTRVAYTYYYLTQSQSATCFPPTCVTTINEGGTGYSRTDKQTAWNEPGFRKHSGWRFPAWVDNATVMLANPTHAPNYDVVLDVPEGDKVGMVRTWFSDEIEKNPGVGGGDVSRDKTKIAMRTGEGDSTLTVYATPGLPPGWKDGHPTGGEPQVCYRYENADGGKYGIPTFSPDGGRIAFHDGAGIKVASVPSFPGGGCTTAGASPAPGLLIPGASEPDWGPADVPAAGATAAGGGGAAGAASLGARVRSATRGGGVQVTLQLPADGKVSGAATRDGLTVAKLRSTSVKAGKRTLTLKFTRSGKRQAKKGAKLQVRVAFTPTGGAARTARLTAKVRR